MPHAQPVKITTAEVPEEDLLFVAMEGTEELGRAFNYQLDLKSPKQDLDFEALLGKDACVEMELANGETRYFHGFITDISQTGRAAGRSYAYRAQLRPWIWFLTRTADCRIYQGKTVPEIIKEVFRAHGYSDFKDSLTVKYTPWEYCVQYRETTFNFLSRLMETEGIYYYFVHEQGKHTLVLTDSYSGHETLPTCAKIAFAPPSEAMVDEHVFDWLVTKSVQPGSFTMVDYDFKRPRTNLTVNSAQVRPHSNAEFDVFDYPGEYDQKPDGEAFARARIEEIHAQYERVRGVCDVRGVCTGGLFTLEEHPRDDQNREYLVVAAHQHISVASFESGDSGELEFQCKFEALDGATPFRSARLTPKPLIQGPQTAIVVGNPGAEILTDEYARVKVKFHWDRIGKDENCSCWVRVSQPGWAGAGWGGIHIPRIGQEVIVEFLEGDPDLPIITGRVYNGENTPPYELPGNATMSGLKTNSSKGGEGFNELRFEDKKDAEQVFLHAQKNLDIRVLNDRFETVMANRHLVIEKDKHEHVKNDRHENVDGHHTETITKDRNLTIEGKEAKAVTKTLSLTVDGEVVEVFKDNHSETVTKDYYVKAKNVVIEGTTNVTIKVGESFIALESGGIKIGTTGKIVLDSKDKIEAKGVGGVKLETPAKMEVEGTDVSVKGQGQVNVEGTGPTTVKSSAILTIQGSLVKIN